MRGWDRLDDLQAALGDSNTANAFQLLLEDEKNFIDLARSTVFMTQEHEIFDERSLDA